MSLGGKFTKKTSQGTYLDKIWGNSELRLFFLVGESATNWWFKAL
jgi:hypothetical protein